MSATFTQINGNTKIDFNYTAATAKVQTIITGAAEYLWTHGNGDHGTPKSPILFSSLTNQQKLDMVDTYIRKSVLALANTNKSTKAQDLARTTEEDTAYTL